MVSMTSRAIIDAVAWRLPMLFCTLDKSCIGITPTMPTANTAIETIASVMLAPRIRRRVLAMEGFCVIWSLKKFYRSQREGEGEEFGDRVLAALLVEESNRRDLVRGISSHQFGAAIGVEANRAKR